MGAAIQFANSTADAKQLRKEAGRWLQGMRKKAGLSQIDLANQLGLKYYTFVSQVENGFGRVPSESMEAWAVDHDAPSPSAGTTLSDSRAEIDPGSFGHMRLC